MKLKNSTHDFYEITRLNKEVCLEVVKKIDEEFPRFKLDHLSYISIKWHSMIILHLNNLKNWLCIYLNKRSAKNYDY
jgi:hypothetical protein